MKYTIRQLEIFLAIAKYQNITTAAESLHLSQSAASTALSHLEENYNILLFERSGKKIKLTQEGRTLRDEAAQLIDRARKFENSLQNHCDLGHIRIGASYTIGNHIAMKLVSDYIEEHPNADVAFKVSDSSNVITQVLDNEIDLGMVEGEVVRPKLDLVHWFDDELVIFCNPQNPLTKKASLSDDDLRQCKFIFREPTSEAGSGLSDIIPGLNICYKFQDNETIKKAVEANLGIGCLSRIVLQDDFNSGLFSELRVPHRDMTRKIYFALSKDRLYKPSVEKWIAKCLSLR